jgi:alginate O-acetyltransferase complex protein AlgI
MIFASFSYLSLLIISLVFFYNMDQRNRYYLLLISTFIFYSAWSVPYSFVLISNIILNYLIGHRINKNPDNRSKKIWLSLGIFLNILVLGYFKYMNFGVQSLHALFDFINVPFDFVTAQIILPLGISFYTLQAIGYLVDVYSERIHAEQDILIFAVFISFFPQLIAGPIERGAVLIPQLTASKLLSWSDINKGINLFLFGLLIKLVFADNLGVIADAVFLTPTEYSSQELLIGVYAFAFQIYFDFSAYSLMAIGSARMFQIKLSRNFYFPYLSSNIQDFWRRWHITLSLWLRDYIYFPLGGSMGTTSQTYRNMMSTMVLCGIWHGAGLNFLFWGIYHGMLLSGYRFLKARVNINALAITPWLTKPIAIFINFHLICLGWLFFRAGSFPEASQIIKGIISLDGSNVMAPEFKNTGLILLTVIISQILYQIFKNDLMKQFDELNLATTVYYYLLMITLVLCFGHPQTIKFIYFEF